MLSNLTDLVIYLIKEAQYIAFYSSNEEEALEDMEWLFTKSDKELSLDWWCNLVGLNPEWTRQQLIESAPVIRNATDRAPGSFLNAA
jgi:hypothetical protein